MGRRPNADHAPAHPGARAFGKPLQLLERLRVCFPTTGRLVNKQRPFGLGPALAAATANRGVGKKISHPRRAAGALRGE